MEDIIENTIHETFEMLSSELESSNIDSEYSGSTVCMLIIVGNVGWFANLGDSRAIVINHDPLNKNNLSVSFSTTD